MLEETARPTLREFFRPAMPRAWFIAALVVAIGLRLLFVFRWASETPDSLVYADVAKTWLMTGVYGMGGMTPEPTLVRLPGYPGFLAIIFRTAGFDHFNAVRFVQTALDVLSCFFVADLARRVVSKRAGTAAFWLYALCFFIANYVAIPLTEGPEIFATSAALWCAVLALDSGLTTAWIGCGVATAWAILLRPDGGILLMILGPYLLWHAIRTNQWRKVLIGGPIVAAIALAPLVPWTIRNWRTFHIIQPLVTSAASNPTEFVPYGFQNWEKTWILDYANVIDVDFHVDGEPIELDAIPNRAFSSTEERERVMEILKTYNERLVMTPDLDKPLGEIAAARIRQSPLQYYVGLPLAKAADMWLRPRTEVIAVDTHWWDIEQGWDDVSISVAFGVVNLLYVGLAAIGLVKARVRYIGLLMGFIVMRSVIIGYITSPEPRYVLECFPVVMILGGAAIDWWLSRRGQAVVPAG